VLVWSAQAAILVPENRPENLASLNEAVPAFPSPAPPDWHFATSPPMLKARAGAKAWMPLYPCRRIARKDCICWPMLL
jgi:hypothetical protein